MYVVLFEEGGVRDYQRFETEEALLEFLMEGRSIKIDKIFESLTELNFGLTPVMGAHVEKIKVEEPESVTEADIIRKNKEALAGLEAEEEPAAPEEEEVPDLSPTKEEEVEKVQKVLDRADKSIEKAKEMMDRKCSVCGVKTILARNQTGICTPCQLKPKKGKKKPGPRKAKF